MPAHFAENPLPGHQYNYKYNYNYNLNEKDWFKFLIKLNHMADFSETPFQVTISKSNFNQSLL